jgi:hypothetical protein
MANLFYSLAVPAADGVGAGTSVSAAGNKKTISVTGTWVGTITVEVSIDGTNYFPLKSYTHPDEITVDAPCANMRVRRSGTLSGTPAVGVSAEDDGTESNTLNMPAADGVGTAMDVSDWGNTVGLLLTGTWTGTVTIEISEDGTSWAQIKSFTANDYVVMTFIARQMRVRRSGNSTGTPQVDIAAGNDADTLVNIFGDGSDGDVTLGSNTTLTRDMYYNSLSMAGYDLTTAGYRVFVKESLLIPALSSIHNSGASGVADAAGAAVAAAMLGGSGAGGAGQTGAGSAGGAIAQCIGGAGGAGGAGGGGAQAGGAAGAKTAPTATEPLPRALPVIALGQYFTPGSNPDVLKGGTGGGGGGGDGAADEGGGGGSGGGVVLVAANRIEIAATGSIQSRGGNGAAGTATGCGGGGGGGGGSVIVVYRALQNAGSINATAGSGGASGGGTGAQGASGSDGNIYQNQV